MPVENKILIRVESSVSLQMKILKSNTNADIYPTTPKQLLWAVWMMHWTRRALNPKIII